ncbi:glycosyltransferase family A protein, partial [Aeromonas caviae]|uniref:glycosyltransferase family A protein n=1 Tax=Aeromonas caviae TaxID=648 RepID=UPI0019D4E3D0
MRKMVKYTVFTPAYNRAHTLERCYKSIVEQHEGSLEWLVIDDGSTDNTRPMIDSFINDAKIKIRYIYQENAGKQAAWNRAVQEAHGEFFICLDSDDALVPGSLKKILDITLKTKVDEKILGVRAVAIDFCRGVADSEFSVHMCGGVASWFDEFASRMFGERMDILKTSEIKKYPYPIELGIKFIPEIWFYAVTASDGYKFIYTDEPVSHFYNDHNHMRLSRSSLKMHAKGHLISRGAMLRYIPMAVFLKNPIALLKTIIRFLQCHI